LRKSGAQQMLIASTNRWALMVDKDVPEEVVLADLVGKFDLANLDLILVEGFKREAIPKIELHRSSLEKPLIFPNDPNIIAIATDQVDRLDTQLPVLPLGDIDSILSFVLNYIGEC
jgi:molybdopterin-guanine dinucleotide biosynthesis protein MobB